MEVLVPTPAHALLNQVVLDNLFQYFDFEEVCICREVCRTWRNAAEKHWWRKGPVLVLRDDYDDPPIINDGEIQKSTTTGEDQWHEIRFKKFRFEDFSFGDDWYTCSTFWKNQGQTMTQITIIDSEITSSNAFQEIFSCKSTPSLQYLILLNVELPFVSGKASRIMLPDEGIKNPCKSLRLLQITYPKSCKYIPCSWDVVFENFYELQTLSLNGYGTDENCELTRVFQGMSNFYLNHGCRHPLMRLDIGKVSWCVIRVSFPDGMLKFFRETAGRKKMYKLKKSNNNDHRSDVLELRSLSFSVENPLDSSELLELVDYQSKQLKRLRIAGNVSSSNRTRDNLLIPSEHFTLPSMQCLTRLDLRECPVAHFKFLLSCPNLIHLNIILLEATVQESERRNPIRKNVPGWGQEEKRHLLLPSLLSFHCNMLMDWDMDDMQQLISWAPNVNSLLIQSNNSSFPALCQGYPRLKRLLLYNNEVSDEIFTGLPKPPLKLPIQPPPPLLSSSSTCTESFKRRPNITDFKELEILAVIHSIYENDEPTAKDKAFHYLLTLFSATNGVLQMPTLKKVYLYKGINDAGLDAIENDNEFAQKLEAPRKGPNSFVVDFTTVF